MIRTLLLVALAVTAGPQTPQPFRLSVNVDLVVLRASVHDRKGRFAPDLRERDFEVYEDGVRQSIQSFQHEDVPVTVGLVIDHSGSMRPKIADVIAAARTFVQFSNQEDQMFVINFNEHVTLGLPGVIRFANRLNELESAILKAPTTGQTALYDAIGEGLDRMRGGAAEKKVLIVISDGGDNASRLDLPQILDKAGKSSAMIYAIGIFDAGDADRNPEVLRRLARATGGDAFLPGEPAEVVAICQQIARDIRNQYTIGYASTSAAQPGAWRAIRVVARAAGLGKLLVRTRAGYIAGGEQRPVRDEMAE